MTKYEKRACSKEMTIARILKNETYTDESGLFINLRKALRKMSFSDLQALEVIISCKDENHLCATTCFHCGDPAMSKTHGSDPRCERHRDV